MSLPLIIIVFACTVGCIEQSSINLENTIWINSKIDSCTSELHFKDSEDCMIYYCGIDESFSGKYFTKADTVVVEEYHLKSEMPGSTSEKEIRFIFKYLLDDGVMRMFYYQDLKYDYTDKGFDESFQFTKKQ